MVMLVTIEIVDDTVAVSVTALGDVVTPEEVAEAVAVTVLHICLLVLIYQMAIIIMPISKSEK
jgi:hypothetical protein